MTQFFLRTQTPTVEIKATAEDAAGKTDSCVIGWLRPSAAEGEALLTEWQEMLKAEQVSEDSLFESERIREFLSSRISYIKDVQLVDEKGAAAFKITDTRKAAENSSTWGDEENCLAWLLSLFLTSAPWWDAFMTGMLSSFTNKVPDSLGN